MQHPCSCYFELRHQTLKCYSFSAIGLVLANRNALPNYAIPVVPDYAECYFSSISDKTKYDLWYSTISTF